MQQLKDDGNANREDGANGYTNSRMTATPAGTGIQATVQRQQEQDSTNGTAIQA
jgi:hypothetical protein